jgi:hypothetical protein
MIRQSWSVEGVPVDTLQGYLSLLRDLVSGGIRDVTVLRRERLLRYIHIFYLSTMRYMVINS